MKINTVISHEYLDDIDLNGKAIIVIDTLRATSVMTTAYANGIKTLKIVKEPKDAFTLREKLLSEDKSLKKEDILLGGERGGEKIEGFDLSNSPLEYTKQRVEGKIIIMTTSNGTKTMMKIGEEHEIIIASLLNVKSVANFLKEQNKDVVIVNAGTDGKLSIEDFITGGAIASYFIEEDLCDTTLASIATYRTSNIDDYIKKSLHYNRIKKLGYNEDLRYCFEINSLDVVPLAKNFEINNK